MKISSVESIIGALNNEKVEYLIAGGLAVVAHGYLRFTADLDLIIHLEINNINRMINALKPLGFKPRAPVALESLANEADRTKWIKEKNLKVFSLWSPKHGATEIDIFIEEPIEFNQAYKRGKKFSVTPKLEAMILGLDDLIKLKKEAGRHKDLDDVEHLLNLRKNKPSD